MRIAFAALSGLRAHDQKLVELGLSMPAIVQRSRIITAMPSLGLLYLAAGTPPHHEVRYFEIPDESKIPDDLFHYDLVAISALSAQAFVAYRIADMLRSRGIRVVIGGLHASVCPDEAAHHVDAVLVGEGEIVWPEFLKSAEKNDWSRKIWRADEFGPVNVETLPIPRYDLLDFSHYIRFPVQTSRGCPWRCDFYASGVMLRQTYRRRPVAAIVKDVEAIKRLSRKPFIEFADDNTFVDKSWGKELCRALIPQKIKWFTETDISVADDHELLDLMREAGCRQVLIGLESPEPTALSGIELKANFKSKRWSSCQDSVRAIQEHGITVNGCFVLGLDGHKPDIFQQVLDFAMNVPLYEVQITVLTPFPGTPLYDRLLAEGRILIPGAWDRCTMFDINFRPKNMSVDELQQGLYWLAERLYSPKSVGVRQEGFFNQIIAARHRPLATK